MCKSVCEKKTNLLSACLNGKDISAKIRSTSKKLKHKSKNTYSDFLKGTLNT